MSALRVPLLDLTVQYSRIRREVESAIGEVCASQRFILGPQVAELERQVARYCAAGHAIGMSSGTDALLAALMALEIGEGDEVVTAPFSFFATAGTIVRAGARPLFCDIQPDTFNISPAAVEAALREGCERRDGELLNRRTGGRVRALMPVHLYGRLADMGPLLALAREFALPLIEDAAQAIGAEDGAGRRAGSIGEIGCLSFFPTKNLGGFGDGGMCTTDDAALAQRLRILRVHGMEPKYFHQLVGGNFRLDELQAAVLAVKLKYLEEWTAARQRNARYYDRALDQQALAGRLARPAIPAEGRHVFHQYAVRARDRDALRAHLQQAGVGTEVYYPVPLHLQACFRYLGHGEGDFPESERAARETLALPIYPELEESQLAYVAERITAFYAR